MLFITDRFPPSEGGSRVYYYNLCAHYPAEKVIVLTKKVDGWREFDRREHFKIVRKGKPLANWKYYQVPRMLSPLLWAIFLVFKEKIRVIHCGDEFPASAIGLLIKKLFGVPYVYYEHGEGVTWYRQFRFQPRIRRIFMKNADRIVAACSYAEEGVSRELRKMGMGLENLVKITPGVDHQRFRQDWGDEDLRQRIDLEGKKIILTLGRLVERKGQDTVIRAMPKILAHVPDALYLIAGRGPHESRLKALVSELELEKHVRFLGFVSNDEIPSLYSVSDVFVMINRDTLQDGPEGFGMVFTEASAAGKPVVGGRSGGNSDSIVDGVTGYRVDPLDVDEVAEKIIVMLRDDNLRKTMGQNGRDWVMKHFNWRDKALQLEKLNQGIFGSDTRSSSCSGEDSKCSD